MYASNEDEFNREGDDWVFLRQTPPTNTIFQGAVNLDPEHSSSSSSSTSSSSSKSDRSDSVSSLASTELEQVENDDRIEKPVLACHDNNGLVLTLEIKEKVLSSEVMIKQDNENETTPIINEYDLSNESMLVSNNLRQRTGANFEQIEEQSLSTEEYEHQSSSTRGCPIRTLDKVGVYGIIFLIFALPFILGPFVSSERPMMDKMTEELKKTNQRLDGIKSISIDDIEQKLTKQLEEKFQKMMNQKMIEHDREKFFLNLQINELYQILNLTQQNLTSTIDQLANENEQLREQVTALEHRVQIAEERGSKEKETCPEGVDCSKSSTSSLDVLLANLIKQTASIAEDTSINLSGLFEQLSASIIDLVDNRHEYVEESKRKFTDFAGSQTAEQVHTTLRRGIQNLSSSFRKAKLTYASWARARAEHREQARMEKNGQEQEQKPVKNPWRWTFQRSQDRERMRHETPITTKHSSNKECVCNSKYDFPVNQLCSMKNWMEKLFRP